MSNRVLILFFLLSTVIKSHSQGNYSYKEIISKRIIGKAFINATKEDSSWITYMGKIYDHVTRRNYYVVREFKKVKAASTWHGHSSVYIFKPDKKLFATLRFGMPGDLPEKLVDDYFYFTYEEKGVKKVDKVKIGFPLPKMFCSKPNGCEEIILE